MQGFATNFNSLFIRKDVWKSHPVETYLLKEAQY